MKTINDLVNRLNELSKSSDFSIRQGKKYTKVVQRMGGVHCFVDSEGNIFKPASWAAPAKGVRASLSNLDLNRVDQFGGWLYRR